jgi:hypothetical protein
VLAAAVDKVMDLATTMQEKGVSQKCQDEAVENLASCATDDSMAVKQGCCSTDCSTGIKKVGWLARSPWHPLQLQLLSEVHPPELVLPYPQATANMPYMPLPVQSSSASFSWQPQLSHALGDY